MLKLSDNIERKYTDSLALTGWEIETDTGFKPVAKVMQTVQYEKWILCTDNLNLECADTHIVFREDMSEVFVKNLSVGDKIISKHGLETVIEVYNTGILENMYDLEVADDNHRFYSNDILSHNSTSTICFLLWYLLFNPSKSVALLANKGATSRMLLARIQLAYYNLPKWLQQGIVDWNKGSFSLENGSRIVAASTSSDSIRGDSFGTIILDEMAFIPKNTYDAFYKSVYPTISSGTETKFIAVSTPNGMNHFYDAWMKAVEKKSRFCAFEVNWWDVPGRDEAWKEEQLANMTEEDFSQEYGNSFIGSCHTLLRPDTLSRIDRDCINAIQSNKQTAIFKEPIRGHKYVATVDCADTGADSSTISILDITNYPYEQVARFKDAAISHLSFPQIIVNFATKYNMADVLVESNDVGKVILHILNYDIGYENIISTKIGARLGLGQRTTSKTKPIGCARLKDMLESGKMVIRDKETSTELKHFILDGHSYAAEEGYHDDIVMGLVNFAYYANTNTFRYHYDSNFVDEYRKEYEESIMEMLTPLPMFSTDLDEPEDNEFMRQMRF